MTHSVMVVSQMKASVPVAFVQREKDRGSLYSIFKICGLETRAHIPTSHTAVKDLAI